MEKMTAEELERFLGYLIDKMEEEISEVRGKY
jgi:hypothetical protein